MNRLFGTVEAIASADGVHLIDVVTDDGLICTATQVADLDPAALPPGLAVTLLFRESEVSLAKHLSGLISLRNQLPCVVTGVHHGRVLTRVQLGCGNGTIESVITTRSAERLTLEPGDEVDALVKASEMLVLPGIYLS